MIPLARHVQSSRWAINMCPTFGAAYVLHGRPRVVQYVIYYKVSRLNLS